MNMNHFIYSFHREARCIYIHFLFTNSTYNHLQTYAACQYILKFRGNFPEQPIKNEYMIWFSRIFFLEIYIKLNDTFFNYKLAQIKKINHKKYIYFLKNPILWTLRRNKFQNKTKFHRSGRKYESCVIYCFHSILVYFSSSVLYNS